MAAVRQEVRMAVLEVRRQHGLTQLQLANGFGLASGRSVSHWEIRGAWSLVPILRAMSEAEPRFACIAQEIWRRCT